METAIQQKIINLLAPIAQGVRVADVRIGLGYTSVRLESGHAGLAWTAQTRSGSCSHEAKAGTLAGRPAGELLALLAGFGQSLSKSIGLATANALAASLERPSSVSTEILELIDVQPSEHVVMVGFFGPVVPRLQKIGCRLDILELNPEKAGTLSPEQGREPLAVCDVAIITATSLITGTMDGLLAGLGRPRAVVILGPSTFMRPEVFAGTKVTHLAGSWVRDAGAVEKIVSEGGGTRILKHHLEFATLCLHP
ncbi:MAG: DUF364 domain-containing protein [Desulfobulbus sp.]|nr:DUF364 domain-containing protein [Desulfobulbus sp.]